MRIDKRVVLAVLSVLAQARRQSVTAQPERVATAWAFSMARFTVVRF